MDYSVSHHIAFHKSARLRGCRRSHPCSHRAVRPTASVHQQQDAPSIPTTPQPGSANPNPPPSLRYAISTHTHTCVKQVTDGPPPLSCLMHKSIIRQPPRGKKTLFTPRLRVWEGRGVGTHAGRCLPLICLGWWRGFSLHTHIFQSFANQLISSRSFSRSRSLTPPSTSPKSHETYTGGEAGQSIHLNISIDESVSLRNARNWASLVFPRRKEIR